MKVKKLIAFFKEEDGLELSEYAVMGGLIVIGLVTAITALHDSIDGVFTAISTEVSSSATTTP